jgi:hypothetical protein
MRLLLQFSLLALVAFASASGSKIVQGTLLAGPDGQGWFLKVGSDMVPISAGKRTKYWCKRAVADEKAFKAGDAVVARIVPDETPAGLRELADKQSWDWLEGIRKEVRDGTMKTFDGKHLTLSFADGTEMGYRATEKSKITLEGKPATLGDLKPGIRLWVKGRTLPTLDVWLVSASDRAIVDPPKKTPSKKGTRTESEKPRKIPASGQMKGEIAVHYQGMNMFDLTVDGWRLHISYFSSTAFTFGGTKCGPNELVPGREATVTYKKDQYGRIDAAKVAIR